jgi:hypothetical protein
MEMLEKERERYLEVDRKMGADRISPRKLGACSNGVLVLVEQLWEVCNFIA